jgi:hypothetical protein
VLRISETVFLIVPINNYPLHLHDSVQALIYIYIYIYINYSIRCYMPISRVKIQTLQTKLVRGERFFKQWLCLSLQKAFYPTKIRFIAWFYINPRCSADCQGSSILLGPCLPRLEEVNFDPKSQQSILLQLPLVC